MQTKNKPEDSSTSFEARLERLEQIADQMKSGSLDIEKASIYFEEGMTLARSLEKDLSKIERRVEVLINQAEEGEKPALELFPELAEITTKEKQE